MSKEILNRIYEKYDGLCIPWTVHFELTYRCNFRCRHCYTVPEECGQELALSEIKRIIRELEEMGTMGLVFSGGEIFLRRDLMDILDFACKRFHVNLLTNGSYIDRERAHKLKEIGISGVEISLYGDKNFHDSLTGVNGSFDMIINSLKWLKEAEIAVTLKCLAMKGNLDQHGYLIGIAQYYGARFKPGVTIYPRTDGSQEPCNLRIPRDSFSMDHLNNWFLEVKQTENNKEKGQYKNKKICKAGRSFASITPDGRVRACPMIPLDLGDLKKRSFKSIWHTEISEELKMLRSFTINDLRECSKCDISGFCVPCIGLNYLENSDFFRPSKEFCRIAYWLFSRQSHPKGGTGYETALC